MHIYARFLVKDQVKNFIKKLYKYKWHMNSKLLFDIYDSGFEIGIVKFKKKKKRQWPLGHKSHLSTIANTQTCRGV